MTSTIATRTTLAESARVALCRACVAVLLALAGGSAWPQAESNPNLNAQLLVAARNNDVAAVERALSQGAAPNSRNRLGKSALLMACEKGQAATRRRRCCARAPT